ncbi:G-protein coupled receptor 84-like isoform X1 [Clavelina lepadiformis]|uniref:G-protein coupled receptor 84-like isoform X1 n=2 Tax=Clavelina lepadiformis TaxID=159417 RepID=UPI0040419311
MNNTTGFVGEDFRFLGITIGIIDIICGSIGNLLTIVVFARNAGLQSSFNCFIISLAAIDFLTATFMMPFNVAGYVKMDWPLGGSTSFTTPIQAFVYFCCGYTSIVCLVVITVNRFISIRFPDSYQTLFSKTRVLVVIVGSWIFAPSFLLPLLVESLTDEKKILGWNKRQFLCTFISLPESWQAYMQILRVLFQFLPIVIMAVLYSAMFWRVKKNKPLTSQLPWEQNKNSTGPEANNLINMNNTELNLNEEEMKIAQNMTSNTKRDNERQLLVVSLAICIVFSILFLPSLIINLLPNRSSLDFRIHMAASNITWLNSCVNPFIYVIANPKFRMEYYLLLKYAWLKFTCKL